MTRIHRTVGRAVFAVTGLFVLLLPNACRQRPAPPAQNEPHGRIDAEHKAPASPIYRLGEQDVDLVLRDLSRREPVLTRRVISLARRHVGQPYKLGVLGEGGAEPYDTDPLYCLSASDCVTFVEQVYAMALASDFAEFKRILPRIRYKDGKVGILTRNHFTEADWNVNNAWLFEDLTTRLGGGRAWVELRQRVDRAAFFKKYGLGREIPVERFVGSYLPRKRLAELEGELRAGDVLQIVRGTPQAPYVSHLGLIDRDDDRDMGPAFFLHSGKPAVQRVLLKQYFADHASVIGFKVLRVRQHLVPDVQK